MNFSIAMLSAQTKAAPELIIIKGSQIFSQMLFSRSMRKFSLNVLSFTSVEISFVCNFD